MMVLTPNKMRALRHLERVTGHPAPVLRKLETIVSWLPAARLMNHKLSQMALPSLWQLVSQLLVPRRRPRHEHHSHIDGTGRRRAVYNVDTITPSGERIQLRLIVSTRWSGSVFARTAPVTRVRLAYRVSGAPGQHTAEVHQELWVADQLAVTLNLAQLTKIPPPIHVAPPLRPNPKPREVAALAASQTIFL
jgi:hypothetical protein